METNNTTQDMSGTGPKNGAGVTIKGSKSSLNNKNLDKKLKSAAKLYESYSTLNAKRAQLVKTARPRQNFGLATQAGVDEIVRLTKVMDNQKELLQRYASEIRTLKIVNQRQEKAIKQMDKEHGAIPTVIHRLNEELRIAKLEKVKYAEKFTAVEKLHQRESDEITRLLMTVKEMSNKLKVKDTEDVLKLKDENIKLKKRIASLEKELEDSQKRYKLLESDKERESKSSRAYASRHAQHIEDLQSEINRLQSKLIDREKQITHLNVYSTHAAERKQLRSRAAEEKRQRNGSDTANVKQNVGFDLKNNTSRTISPDDAASHRPDTESHPYTDALMESIMKKTPASPEPATSTIHKPNLNFPKISSDEVSKPAGKVDSIEDILARRMREQVLAHDN